MDAIAPLIDPTAVAIVAGGTALATCLRTPARDLGRAILALATLGRRGFDATPLLEQLAALARIARRHGIVALDKSVITDPDLAAGIAAIVDGMPAAEVAALVRHRRLARIERHVAAADMWAGAAEAAPAMGMVGTLIGLARMFAAMGDPATIGSAMAIALLATLYGALLGNLVFLPIAYRLRSAGQREAFERARLEAPLERLAIRERPRTAAVPIVPAPLLQTVA